MKSADSFPAPAPSSKTEGTTPSFSSLMRRKEATTTAATARAAAGGTEGGDDGGGERRPKKRRRKDGDEEAAAAARRGGDDEGSGGDGGSTARGASDRGREREKGGKKGTKKKKKKRRSGGAAAEHPVPGEGGCLTPTQIRNARRRRAKKRRRDGGGDGGGVGGDTGGGGGGGSASGRGGSGEDPSARYLSDPRGAPAVRAAAEYFRGKLPRRGPLSVRVGPVRGWRTVSKLPVRPDPSNGRAIVGMFRPGSHEVLPLTECAAHHPSVDGAVRAVRMACAESGVRPYDEGTGTGWLRYVAVNVERATGRVQLTLVWNSGGGDGDVDVDGAAETALRTLSEWLIREGGGECDKDGGAGPANGGNEHDEEGGASERKRQAKDKKRRRGENGGRAFSLHSLWVHYNSTWKHSSAIFDWTTSEAAAGWELLYGPASIVESLNLTTKSGDAAPAQPRPVRLSFPPNVFRQANLDAFANVVRSIRNRLARYARETGGSKGPLPSCVELYGGVGTIGLNVADLVSSLISSDENPNNERCFNGSALSLPSEVGRRVSYVPKNAADMVVEEGALRDDEKAEVLIVDPPRKGLDDEVMDALVNGDVGAGPKFLVYVSCGFKAFVRDCDRLLESGRWKIDHAEGHLLFPGSNAIETLAFFLRK